MSGNFFLMLLLLNNKHTLTNIDSKHMNCLIVQVVIIELDRLVTIHTMDFFISSVYINRTCTLQ